MADFAVRYNIFANFYSHISNNDKEIYKTYGKKSDNHGIVVKKQGSKWCMEIKKISGNVGIGTTTPTARLHVVGGTTNLSAAGNGAVYLDAIGSDAGTALIVTSSNLIQKTSSSARYKANIEPWVIGKDELARFVALSPQLWDYKGKQTGAASFIAEDLDSLGITNSYGRSVLVNYDAQGRPDSNRDSTLIALQHLVLQDHDKKIEAQQKEIENLNLENGQLKIRLEALESKVK